MNNKFTKKTDYQAYVDLLIHECECFGHLQGNKEIECHLDVDLVLSDKFQEAKKPKLHKTHKETPLKHNTVHKNHSLHSTYHPHIISQPRREKLIINLNDEYRKNRKLLKSVMNFMFA